MTSHGILEYWGLGVKSVAFYWYTTVALYRYTYIHKLLRSTREPHGNAMKFGEICAV